MKARVRFAIVLASLSLAPRATLATWSADPVTVRPTSDACRLVAGASDAQRGAIVVWQQDEGTSPTQYRLRAQHLLATGDLDPAWPAAGVLAGSSVADRAALGAVGDGTGGAYVWWMEGSSLLLLRLRPDGTLPPNWPASGKYLGSLPSAAFRPQVLADGQGGVWIGSLAGALLNTTGRIWHLGPDGQGTGGWPGFRSYAPSEPWVGGMQTLAFAFAPAPDGGAWIAWGDALYDQTGFHAGSWRLLRVTNTGLPAAGWTGLGLAVAEFQGERLGDVPYFAASPLAVAPDGANGVYLLRADVLGEGNQAALTPRLFRHAVDGSLDPSWPTAGVEPLASGLDPVVDAGANASLRLFPESAGGVFALRPSFYDHGTTVALSRFTAMGTQVMWAGADLNGLEWIVPPSGETFLASFWPRGPVSPISPIAFIGLDQTYASGAKGPGFFEWHDQPVVSWYGDIGLAPVGTDGAILAWSQSNERYGVFARRFGPAGEVTGAPTSVTSRGLHLRFDSGRGVVATLGAATGGRLQLLDVAGRVIAGANVPAGAREVMLEGAAGLRSGLYFARHRGADGRVESGRVVIAR